MLRRLHLDLIGLPPTPAQVESFLADRSAGAYERVVDELLASPRFGEKWARHWLDLARYADSNGYQRDGFRTLWPYRDWVIKAMNTDKPYDQFAIEQLAGDLLPNATLDQKVATGFNRGTTINVEAGTVPEADRVGQVIDRVNVMGTAFLGLTVGCAQCHDHKYDPITQRDFYRLFAYFNQTPIGRSRLTTARKPWPQQGFTDALPSSGGVGARRTISHPAALEEADGGVPQAATRSATADKVDAPTQKEAHCGNACGEIHDAIAIVATLVMEDMPQRRQTFILKRGQYDSPLDPVEAGTPALQAVLPGVPR